MIVIHESPTEVIYETSPAPLYLAEAPVPQELSPDAPVAGQSASPTYVVPEPQTPEVLDAEVVQPPVYPPWSRADLPAAPPLHRGPYQPYPYASGPGVLRRSTDAPGVSSLVELEPSVGQQDGVRAGLFDVRWLLEDRFEVPAGVVGLWEPGAWAVLGRAGVGYRFFEARRLLARVEGGGRFWLDDVEPAVGCYGGLGLSAYLVKPVTLDLDANYGVVGAARVFEGSAFVGLGWKRAALRIGYRALYVDDVSLSSPMIGVGVWL
ncbi:MAG: hypothetical protein JW940_17970 [Polyangiaceae bacterium]|nr:hypothetical protein [Polyangiaceae bacterium]